MNDIEFASAEVVVVLPSKKNPKVYLAIDSAEVAKLSFQLYNPFSTLGRLLKRVIEVLAIRLNGISKLILPTLEVRKSAFITYLEDELNTPLISSVYVATAKDKVVLQLIVNNKIFGYLKFPISSIGISRINTEKEGIQILSGLGVVPKILYTKVYKNTPFIILRNLEGTIGDVSAEEYKSVILQFKKSECYTLQEHPRVISVLGYLKKYDLNDLIVRFNEVAKNSESTFLEVYEHGDFAPWNLIRTAEGLQAFDFEYFVEVGLEFMDEIKYHFQIAHHLKGLSGKPLLDAVIDSVNSEKIKLLLHFYLLKEIMLKTEEGISVNLEMQLLELLDEKA